MSQMSKHTLKVTMSDVNTLTAAIRQIASTKYPGMTCSMEGSNVVVRYKGIEQYRHDGNLKFKWTGATFDAVADSYQTKGMLEQVLQQVEIAYRQVGVVTKCEMRGSIVKESIQGGLRIRLRTR